MGNHAKKKPHPWTNKYHRLLRIQARLIWTETAWFGTSKFDNVFLEKTKIPCVLCITEPVVQHGREEGGYGQRDMLFYIFSIVPNILLPVMIWTFHSFRPESYVRSVPTTPVLMSSQSWTFGQVDDLPAVGHRWGLLFSLLCGWERTTETDGLVSAAQVEQTKLYFNTGGSQTRNILHKKWGGSWKDWFTLWGSFKSGWLQPIRQEFKNMHEYHKPASDKKAC